MPIIKRSGVTSQVDQKLKTKRQQIIEEERARVLKESLMLFYDKLMEKYELIYARHDNPENKANSDEFADEDAQPVKREEIETFAVVYAETKPIGF